MSRLACVALIAAACMLPGCANILSEGGPTHSAIDRSATDSHDGIELIDVNENILDRLARRRATQSFAELQADTPAPPSRISVGDVLSVTIWEAPPAVLFSSQSVDASGLALGSRGVTLPEQRVAEDGSIRIPFAGAVKAGGRALTDVGDDIAAALSAKAHLPQVLVQIVHPTGSSITTAGDFSANARIPLVPGADRVLDVVAAAGGVRQPVSKVTVQITRGARVASMPLDTLIRDPTQNVRLGSGDLLTALYQPFSFVSLGATGKNEEIPLEASGITLNQALARAGGLVDARSNPRGVFIFRLMPSDALDWKSVPRRTIDGGFVPTILRVDMTKPEAFFLARELRIENGDVLYVSNAPVTEIQKFLNLLFLVAYPVMTAKQAGL